MLTRRQLGQGLGAAALAAGIRPAVAAPVTMRLANAAGVNDAQLSFLTVGRHPKLGYYAAEGLDVDIINMSSSSQTLQALATDAVDCANLSGATYLPIFAKNPSLNIISVYVWMRRVQVAVAGKPDSAIKPIGELRGTRVGTRNTGDTGSFALQSMFEELGIDRANGAEWIWVGSGGPAGAALESNRIDALSIWDAELARVEI